MIIMKSFSDLGIRTTTRILGLVALLLTPLCVSLEASAEVGTGRLLNLGALSGRQENPCASYSPKSHQYLVTWSDWNDQMGSQLRGRFVKLNGELSVPRSFTERVPPNTDRYMSGSCSVSNIKDGSILLYWLIHTSQLVSIYGRIIDSNGTAHPSRLIYEGESVHFLLKYHPVLNEYLFLYGTWQYRRMLRIAADATVIGETKQLSSFPSIERMTVIPNPESTDYFLFYMKGNQTRFRKMNADGTLPGTSVVILPVGFQYIYDGAPTVAYHPSRKEFLFVYKPKFEGAWQVNARSQKLGLQGYPIGSAQETSLLEISHQESVLAVNNGYLLVYYRGFDVYARELDFEGKATGREKKISMSPLPDRTNTSGFASVQSVSLGQVLVAWSTEYVLYNTYGRFVFPQGEVSACCP